MIEQHQGSVQMKNTFDNAFKLLRMSGSLELTTSRRKSFTAVADNACDGRRVIRFFQGEKEYARSYECCWSHYYNCNRTRIGMYCKALDERLLR